MTSLVYLQKPEECYLIIHNVGWIPKSEVCGHIDNTIRTYKEPYILYPVSKPTFHVNIAYVESLLLPLTTIEMHGITGEIGSAQLSSLTYLLSICLWSVCFWSQRLSFASFAVPHSYSDDQCQAI